MSSPLDFLPPVPAPNENFQLAEQQDVFLHVEGETVSGRGSAKVKWFPRPRVEFQASFDTIIHGDRDAEYEIEFPERTNRIPLLWTNQTISNDGTEMTLQAERQPFCVCSGGRIDRVFFYLLNFPELHSIGFPTDPLQADGWQVSFRPIPGAEDIYEELDEVGGYAFTHVGEIRRKNGNSFSIEMAESLTEMLHFFFSFSAGAWTPLVFPVGLNESDEKVWEEWGFGKNHMFGTRRLSWLDQHTGEALADVFPGFYEKWTDPAWKKTLNDVIYWYVNANNQTQGTDTGIILAQAALELLAWTDLTQVRQLMSESHFEGNHAQENFRALLQEVGIPQTVPSRLKDLCQLANTLRTQYPDPGQTIDGPKIFSELRNNLVHPKDKRVEKHKRGRVMYEGATLGLWYIELLLLCLFDYDGEYANRCERNRHVGQTEPVPCA